MICPETAPALGAYVLGALSPAERQQFEQHLASCPICTAELAEFAGLPAVLDRVRPEDLQLQPMTPSPAVQGMSRAEFARPRR